MADDFLQFYEHTYDDIYRYVYCKTGNTWNTDDIVSEVFLKAYRHFNPNRPNNKAWLVTIARNSTVDFFRRSGREIPGEVPEKLEFITALDNLEHQLETACLKSVLSRLDSHEFEVANLRFFCGLKFKEMAEVLEMKPGTVKMRVYRTLEGIRKKVASCLENTRS